MVKQNSNLHKAKKEKNDEFYTQLADIQGELKHYKDHFNGKVVFCNCDLPESNFVKYFQYNFNELGLRGFLSSGYNKDNGDGDFRSAEVIGLLKQADIVVTNPPFSLFREYIAQLIEHDKKFLVIGNMNAVTYKEIFKLIHDNKIWLGVSPRGMDFQVSDGSLKNVNTTWFTNLTHKKRNEFLDLYKQYNPSDYPHYDNYDAINVDKVNKIPYDFSGHMGVPITFLEKYNPEQFEIIWTTDRGGDGNLDHIKKEHIRYDAPVVSDKGLYKRIIIKHKKNKC